MTSLKPVVWRLLFIIVTLHVWGAPVSAQARRGSPAERRTELYFKSIRNRPGLLYDFLRRMPKGGDLHNHLTGAIYAETYIEWAAEAGLCIDQSTLVALPPPCSEAGGRPPAGLALKDIALHRRVVDSWSMRNREASGQSGHDHFFDTFFKFNLATTGRLGEMIADVTARAGGERVSYLELIMSPDDAAAAELGRKVGWRADFAKQREALLANDLRPVVEAGRRAVDGAEEKVRRILKCDGQGGAGCRVTVRYLYQVLRAGAPEEVFAQTLVGFETASVDPRVVGVNLVQPEDWHVPMRDFTLHMQIIKYLRGVYPNVNVTLHAGELAPGLVPTPGLRSHIRQSVEVAGARRIGHGVSIMHEDDPLGLLREMARRDVLVEVCLTSNDLILGVRGRQHPLSTYMEFGVPVALGTDDEGVARSEMTGEYLKAVNEQGLTYVQLKTFARNSLEYAFMPGKSLWKEYKRLAPVDQCGTGAARGRRVSQPCRQFLQQNEKARMEWELEADFSEFEGRH